MDKTKAQALQDFQDELEYHKREWRAERIGWLALFLFIVAALLGFFGGGPLSDKTVGDTRAATLHYERFLRLAAPTQLELTIATGRPGPIAIEVSESWLRDFEVTSIAPLPRSSTLVGDRHQFEFDLEAVPATIVVHAMPGKVGNRHGSVTVAGTQLDFSQFVYP